MKVGRRFIGESIRTSFVKSSGDWGVPNIHCEEFQRVGRVIFIKSKKISPPIH